MSKQFIPGKEYLLVLPESKDRGTLASNWNNTVVTYYKTGSDSCLHEVEPSSAVRQVGPFTAWVKHPTLKTNYKHNVFLAKPEWLQELPEHPETWLCGCSSREIFSFGCKCGGE